MTEENKEVVVETNEVDVEQPKYTEDEQKALASGWVPKDQWDGEPDEWVSARQFNKNGELFGRINSYKNKILNLETQVGALVKHNESVYDAGYKDAMSELKLERRQALREGDTEKVLELEERAEELQQEHLARKQKFEQEVKAPAAAGQMHPSWEPWLDNNRWYEADPALRGYADGEAKIIVQSAVNAGKTIDYPQLLNEVSRKVRQKFPEKFGGPKTVAATNKSDNDTGAASRTSKSKEPQLTAMEEEIFQTLAKSGITREKYIKDLQAVKKRKGA